MLEITLKTTSLNSYESNYYKAVIFRTRYPWLHLHLVELMIIEHLFAAYR